MVGALGCRAARYGGRRRAGLIARMQTPAWLIRFAPALFVFIWSSGYIVAKVAAPHAEPLSFLLVRYAGVVALMLALAVLWQTRWPSRREALHLAVAGIGIQALYLGGVWVAVKQGLPAGIAALIVNLQPVLTAALAPLVHERVSRVQWLGVALGLAGVLIVLWPKLTQAGDVFAGPALLCVMSLLAITAATLYQKRLVPSFDVRAGQVIQFAASFAVTLPFALAFESFHIEWNAQVAAAMAWSIVVLTGGGMSLMFLMLRHGKATTMTGTMYLVPSITAAMAWLMFGETLAASAVAGMLVTLFGVYLVVKK
jgi:drug/metabolite transporter (DMT)-like permease